MLNQLIKLKIVNKRFPLLHGLVLSTTLCFLAIPIKQANAVSIKFTVANPVSSDSGDSGTIHQVPTGWVAGGMNNANNGTVQDSFAFGINGSILSSTPPATILVSTSKSAFANWSISGTFTLESDSENPAGTKFLGDLSAVFKGANQAVSVSTITGFPSVEADTQGTFTVNPFGTFNITPTPNPAKATPVVPFVPSTNGGTFNIPISRQSALTVGTTYSWNIDLRTRAEKGFGIGLAGSNATAGYDFSDVFTVSATPVPEPLTILGSATALGFGALLKRESSKKRKK